MRRTLLAAATSLLAASTSALRVEDVPCPATCQSDLDCSLNGLCNTTTQQCQCADSWTGTCCTALKFRPAQLHASGYRHPQTSTWGGNIVPTPNADGSTLYHMWIAEMAPNGTAEDPGAGSCGLTTWSSNSQITHVVSNASMLGPFERREVAVGVWSHNPIVRVMPDSTYVLYHIGGGGNNKPGDGYCAGNATSPCGEQSFDQCNPVDPCAAAGPVAGYSCYTGFCSGDAPDAHGLEGDCGNDIAEPSLQCNDFKSCAVAAAASCGSTSGCASFGLSANWGLGKAKLFSAGKAGLTPNAQWAVWVQNNASATIEARGVDPAEWTDGRRRRARTVSPLPEHLPPTLDADGGCMLNIHVAANASGPWTPYTNATITPCGGNNPAPWVHPNGTVYIVFTDQDMGLWRADTWEGPYTLVTRGACGGGEDPSLFIDTQGHFHCMFHRSPFSDPDIAIGHAYSVDGFTWYVSVLPAANSSIEFDSGLGVVVHGKRERPHPYMDPATGAIVAFVSGVCINPACDPLDGGSIDPTADCSSGTQYGHCDANSPGPGWYDRTYTLVQGVGSA
jgi:hypothetical protein